MRHLLKLISVSCKWQHNFEYDRLAKALRLLNRRTILRILNAQCVCQKYYSNEMNTVHIITVFCIKTT